MKYPIPEKALEMNIIVLGKTRSGKSSTVRVFVEQLLADAEEPICIIDPKGDWWGLKLAKDGKHPGFAKLVVLGGDHADIPITEHAGAAIAELVCTTDRSYLIDLGGWMVGERTRFFIDFASNLFKLHRGRRKLIIDEVHNFCPKGKIMSPEAGKMLHWANRLASEGSGKGIILIAASQRSQKVHNDFLTSCETLIAKKVIHKADRNAIKDWIDGCGDPDLGKELLATIASLKRDTAWVWSPEIDFGPQRVTFPLFSTYDSFKPQPADAKFEWKPFDLDTVRDQLLAYVRVAEQNDPKVLHKRIGELERELKKPREPAMDEDMLARECAKSYDQGVQDGRRGAELAIGKVSASFANLQVAVGLMEETLQQNAVIPPQDIRTVGGVSLKPHVPLVDELLRAHGHRDTSTALQRPLKRLMENMNNADADLPPGEAAVLRACIQFAGGIDRTALTVLTGYKRSSRDAYIARLKQKALIVEDGIHMKPTEAGRMAMPNATPLPTGVDLQEYWRAKLPEGERKILDVLIQEWPDPVARGALEHTGYKRSSRDAYLARLAAKNLVEEAGRGCVKASDNLFS
jgi:hypothetical protein